MTIAWLNVCWRTIMWITRKGLFYAWMEGLSFRELTKTWSRSNMEDCIFGFNLRKWSTTISSSGPRLNKARELFKLFYHLEENNGVNHLLQYCNPYMQKTGYLLKIIPIFRSLESSNCQLFPYLALFRDGCLYSLSKFHFEINFLTIKNMNYPNECSKFMNKIK